jgi:hypothetical protein
MNIQHYIQEIQIYLIQTNSRILDWFNVDRELKNYRPVDKGWTVSEILEHIVLTSHYLLILIDKGTKKALNNVQNESLKDLLDNFQFNLDNLDEIGMHKSFDWVRPTHMEPTGTKTDYELKCEMIEQMMRCLNHLNQLKNGEGLLYKTTMTVNDLGKINVYEYIYFLSKHAERHIRQMVENKNEFEKIKKLTR